MKKMGLVALNHHFVVDLSPSNKPSAPRDLPQCTPKYPYRALIRLPRYRLLTQVQKLDHEVVCRR